MMLTKPHQHLGLCGVLSKTLLRLQGRPEPHPPPRCETSVQTAGSTQVASSVRAASSAQAASCSQGVYNQRAACTQQAVCRLPLWHTNTWLLTPVQLPAFQPVLPNPVPPPPTSHRHPLHPTQAVNQTSGQAARQLAKHTFCSLTSLWLSCCAGHRRHQAAQPLGKPWSTCTSQQALAKRQ